MVFIKLILIKKCSIKVLSTTFTRMTLTEEQMDSGGVRFKCPFTLQYFIS